MAIRISVKSVNHRFLDIKLRMPDSLEPYELRLRQAVKNRIHRGHIDIHVNVEPGEAAPVHVNRELLQAYLRAADELRQQTGAKSELDLVSLLRFAGGDRRAGSDAAGFGGRAGGTGQSAGVAADRRGFENGRDAPHGRAPPDGRASRAAGPHFRNRRTGSVGWWKHFGPLSRGGWNRG